jgi:hypothetical protein
MARYAATESTTIREELEARISILSPMDTPLQALLPTRPVENWLYDWQADEITTPVAVQADAPGDTIASGAGTHLGRQRLHNEVMIVRESVDIEDSLRYMDEAGVSDEYAWALAKKHLETAKQMEFNIHHGEYASRGSGTPVTGGVIEWAAEGGVGRSSAAGDIVVAGNTFAAGTATAEGGYGAIWTDYATPMTEAQFNTLLQDAWFQGIDINACVLFSAGPVKRAISDFSHTYGGVDSGPQNLSRTTINQELKKRIVCVDIYGSDFGELHMALDRYMAGAGTFTTTVGETAADNFTLVHSESFFAIDPMFHRIATLRPLGYSPIAKRGDSSEAYVFSECGYQPDNPLAIFGASGVV